MNCRLELPKHHLGAPYELRKRVIHHESCSLHDLLVLNLASSRVLPRAASHGLAAMNPHPYPSPSPYPLPPPGQHSQHPQQAPHPQQHQHHDYQQTAAAALSAPPPQPSQPHIPTPNNTAAPNGRKRKAGQPGSRGVANLTPEQLAKKRANDREAQRAIRERTKNTIEGLEARIRELESQQPYQELQRALADRDRALQECEALRTRLAAVAGIVGNRDLGQTGLNGMVHPINRVLLAEALLTPCTELAALTAQQSPLPSTSVHSTPSHYPQVQPSPAQQYEQAPQQHLHPDLRSPNNSSATDSPGGAQSQYQSSEGQARKWTPEAQAHHYPAHSLPYEQQPRSAPAAQMQQPSEHNGERLGVNFLLEQQHGSPVPKPKASLPDDEPGKATLILSRSIRTCPLDHLVGSFVQERRNQLASGAPLSQVIGPDKPSLISLTHPDAKRGGASTDSLTPLLLNILSKFPDIDRDPERLAVLYGMYYLARWFVCPCASCLEDCPGWARPIPEAAENQHPVWIDYLPWPSMRRKLYMARTPGTRPHFEDFFVTFTKTMSVNWPYPQSSCLNITPSSVPGELPSIELSRAFTDHITHLGNWSIGPAFASVFPELVDESVRVVQRHNQPTHEQQQQQQ